MPHAIRRISGAKIVIFFQTAMTQRNNFAPDNPLQEKTSTRPIGFIQCGRGAFVSAAVSLVYGQSYCLYGMLRRVLRCAVEEGASVRRRL